MRSALDDIANARLSMDDLVLFFFAGHGYSFSGEDYLVFSDTEPRNNASALCTDDIVSAFLKSGAAKSIIILDACRLESERGHSAFGEATAKLAHRKGFVVFFGCSPGQVCHEIPELRHGVFTYSFHKVLKSLSPATPLSIDAALDEHLREICHRYNLDKQEHRTIASPVQNANLDLLTGAIVPQAPSRKGWCIVIAGPSHSGRSTIAQKLANKLNCPHVEMSTFAWTRYDREIKYYTTIYRYMTIWKNLCGAHKTMGLLQGILYDTWQAHR